MSECKRCLLLQAGEWQSFEQVRSYIETLDSELKVDDKEYARRLGICGECDNLISGMCLKCGCYVELRAALKNKSCPDFDNVRWHKL